MNINFIWICISTLLATGYSFSRGLPTQSSASKLSGNYKADTASVNELNRLAQESFSYDVRRLHTLSRQAATLAQKIHYKQGEATAYQHIAMSYMLIHGDVTALDYLKKALTLFEQQKDTVQMAGTINYIGCYYATIKDYSQALPFFLQSEKLIGSRKHRLLLTILSNTGSCYEDLGKLDKAALYYNHVKTLANEIHDYSWIVTSLYQEASIYFLKNSYGLALSTSKDALAVAKIHQVPPRDIMALYLLMGNIYYKQKQYGLSRQYYQNAANSAFRMNSREGLSEVHQKMYLLDSISGNYKSALANLNRHKMISDSLVNERKNRLSTLFKIKYDLNEEELKNSKLLLEKQAQEGVIFYQRLLLFVTVLLSVFTAIIAFRLRKANHKLSQLNMHIGSQNEELSKLNGIKNRLFSVIAHDLRSPFAQFMSLLDIIDSKMIDPQEISELMPYLNKSATQTMSMMDNLLNWSRSQMDGFVVSTTYVKLHDLIVAKVRAADSQIRNKQISIDVLVDQNEQVWADKEMLRIIIRNLLTNAVKFTPAGGRITFSSVIDRESIILAIKDSGVGISAENLSKLFSNGAVSTRGTEQESGVGIGLKICQDLVQLNKGHIWVESEPGKGSTFYVSLPKAASAK